VSNPSTSQLDQWITAQLAQLSEAELQMLKTVLDEIKAGRPVKHFPPGSTVYVRGWGTTKFVVQGTAPYYDSKGVATRKVEVKCPPGSISGHIEPSELHQCATPGRCWADPDCPVYSSRKGNHFPPELRKEVTVTITDRDIREKVAVAVGVNGTEAEGIDIDAVVAEIQQKHGLVDIDTIDHDEFWEIVRRHDSTQRD
jgi:hypothetical protein